MEKQKKSSSDIFQEFFRKNLFSFKNISFFFVAFFALVLLLMSFGERDFTKFASADVLSEESEIGQQISDRPGEYKVNEFVYFYLSPSTELKISEKAENSDFLVPQKISVVLENGELKIVNLSDGIQISAEIGDAEVTNFGGTTILESSEDIQKIVCVSGMTRLQFFVNDDEIDFWLSAGESLDLKSENLEKLALLENSISRLEFLRNLICSTAVQPEEEAELLGEIFAEFPKNTSFLKSAWLDIQDFLSFVPAARERVATKKANFEIAQLARGEEIDFENAERILPYFSLRSSKNLPPNLRKQIANLKSHDFEISTFDENLLPPKSKKMFFDLIENSKKISSSDLNAFAEENSRQADLATAIADQIFLTQKLVEQNSAKLAAQSLQSLADLIQKAKDSLPETDLREAAIAGENFKNKIIFLTKFPNQKFDELAYGEWAAENAPKIEENDEVDAIDWSSKILRLRPQWFELFATR